MAELTSGLPRINDRAIADGTVRKVFVSGCYDVLHAGHLQFFADARRLGTHLTVSVGTDEVLLLCKGRRPSLPFDHKMALISALRGVDRVVASSNLDPVFDFRDTILRERPHVLAVTDDDLQEDAKRRFCQEHGIELAVLPKRSCATPVSTTTILSGIRGNGRLPLRVDFAGGWLDVPRLARPGAFIVNCAIQPLVSLRDWTYETCSGLGGSAARAMLEVKNGLRSELGAGVGWQDPAIIEETGACAWRSGRTPVLELKTNPDWLAGRMLIYWTGSCHDSARLVDYPRNYAAIAEAGLLARHAVERRDLDALAHAVRGSYAVQLEEGMLPLPDFGELGRKYLGAGHGGYALYLFAGRAARDDAARLSRTKVIEPWLREPSAEPD